LNKNLELLNIVTARLATVDAHAFGEKSTLPFIMSQRILKDFYLHFIGFYRSFSVFKHFFM